MKEKKSLVSGINNLEIDKNGGYLIVSVNPKIYPLEIIYSAAYVFLDKGYILIDGNPEEEIFVQIKPKNKKENLEKLGNEFNNELVNYAVYVVQASRNQPLRKAIIERVLLTNTIEDEECPECKEEESKKEEENFIVDDPLGIAKPWSPPKETENEKPKNREKKG